MGVPDTAVLLEGSKKYVYKVLENNTVKKTEIETGIRNKGNLEVLFEKDKLNNIFKENLPAYSEAVDV